MEDQLYKNLSRREVILNIVSALSHYRELESLSGKMLPKMANVHTWSYVKLQCLIYKLVGIITTSIS